MDSVTRVTILILLVGYALRAQTTITGTVRDASSGEPLPAANLQIEGSYKGAITNKAGRYVLKIDTLPATVLVRYIGYESYRLAITRNAVPTQDIGLTPAPIQMEGVVITGEDPAIQIMRNVIRKKQRWHGRLANFKANIYSRIVMENDSGIVMISESLGDIHWDRFRGIRAVIKSKRSTRNVDPEDVVFSPDESIVNFYDDDVQIQDSRFVGPTHPAALSYYDFKLIG
jgi:hypothetical protein